MDTLPFWKKIYQTVTGYSANITNEIIEEVLKLSNKGLLEGILTYKQFKEDSFNHWSTKSSKIDADVRNFVRRLSKDLNLETNCAWLILCNYLMFEYYGKIKDIKSIARYESNAASLTRNIWHFYSAERMFTLRTLRHIFECLNEKNHKFYIEYKQFVDSLDINQLKNNLIAEFGILIEEISPNVSGSEYLEPWIYRNNREQIEILMLITIITEYIKIEVKDFLSLFDSFMKHSFTRHPLYFESTLIVPQIDFYNVKCAEIGCFMTILNQFSHSDNIRQFLVKSVEDKLLEIQVHGNQTVVLFMWIILRLKEDDINNDSADRMNYIRLILQLFNKDVLRTLYEVMCSPVLKENRAGNIVFNAIFELLNEMFKVFPDHKFIYINDGIVLIATEIFKNKTLIHKCINGRSGFNSLSHIAYHAFPFDFFSFTKLCSAMLESEIYTKETLDKLYNMNSYLSVLNASAADGEFYTLNEEYSPLENINGLKFPPSTRVQSYHLFGKNYARFIKRYNYFTLIEQMLLSLINDSRRSKQINLDLASKVVEGYNLIIQLIKHSKISNQDLMPVYNCIESAYLIWPTFSKGDLKNVDLISVIFHLEVNLFIYRNQNLRSEFIPVFLPKLLKSKYSIAEMTCREIYDKCITLVCLHEEERTTSHVLLVQYLELIHHVIEKDSYHQEIQLPGITYIVNHVFPLYENWSYEKEEVKAYITKKIMMIFHKILQYHKSCSNDVQKQITNFLVYSLFNNNSVVESYFNLLAKGNKQIHDIITQVLPSRSKNIEMFKYVRLQLSVLLFLTKFSSDLNNESLFQEKLKFFVKPLTSFIGNPYNSHIAQLSCRLVEVISRDSTIPMLALLEMDYHQVQSFFLEKLRDPVEDDELKFIIIDLIETCIRSQHGMTAAFFNVPTNKQWYKDSENERVGDSMSDFMLDYLQNVKKNPQSLENPLQLGILKILQNLWANRKNNLIKDVVALKQFWFLLANPLYCSFTQDGQIYGIIFNILSLHLCNSVDIDFHLKQAVEKFFKDKHQIEQWIEFMDRAFQYVPLSTKDETAKNKISLLKSWIEFILITKKFVPESFDLSIKILLTEHCLDGVLYHFTVPSYTKAPIMWMELYLMLITDWKVTCNRETDTISKLINILVHFNNNINVMSSRVGKIYLSVIYNTITQMKTFFDSNSKTLQQFLMPVGKILSHEYDELCNSLWSSEEESVLQNKITNWLLSISIVNSLMDLKTIQEHSLWFRLNHFIDKIVNSFKPLFGNQKTYTIIKFMLNSLVQYANTPMVFDFLAIDIIKISESMKIPDDFCLYRENTENIIPVYLREWCASYMLLIKLLHTLVKKLGCKMVHNACMFFMLNDRIISEIFLLLEHSADKTSLLLIREILDFVNTLMDWKYLWYCCFKDSFFGIITGVKKCLNACISVLLRPNNLLCYAVVDNGRLEVVQEIPQMQLVSVANIFIEISCLASQCLLKANRTLLDYFDVYKSYDPIFEIIENDFGVPHFELPISSNVSFGRLLCLVHFLCKTLNHLLSSANDQPLIEEKPAESLLSFSKRNQYENLLELLNLYSTLAEATILFIQYEGKTNIYSNQKLSSFFRYAMYEYTGLSAAWVFKLDKSKIEKTLEVIMTLLASQIFLYTRTMPRNQLIHYKRELCAELLFITEFVKKHMTDESDRNMQSFSVVSRNKSNVDEADKNYLVVISQWLINICQLYGDSYTY